MAADDKAPDYAAEAFDQVSDEHALAEAPPMPPQLPTMTIPLAGTGVKIVKEDGDTAMIVGPLLVHFLLPFSDEGARGIARELTGGIEIASIVPFAGGAE